MRLHQLGTYALLTLWTPVYLVVFILASLIRGAYEQISVDFPKEWRMIKNSWRAVRV